MEKVAYGDYLTELTPRQLQGTGAWTQYIQIACEVPGGCRVQSFTSEATFPTRDEAVVAGGRFGCDVIDGKVPDCSVRF